MKDFEPIAFFHSPFGSKFGVPKQSGLVESLKGTIVFAPDYRSPDFIRGIDEFDYLWLIWEFSANRHAAVGATVRPPLLGGNQRMGVFATRSPFRPNPMGLSSVRLERVEWQTAKGPVLHVLGADLMEGTPILDIKPYVAYADCHENVRSGFVDHHALQRLDVEIPENIRRCLGDEQTETLREVLALDPRPRTQSPSTRVYGMPFGQWDVKFTVLDNVHLQVVELVSLSK